MGRSGIEWALRIGVAFALVWLGAGCAFFVDADEKAREVAPEIRVGSEREDFLHCERDRCDQWFRLIVERERSIVVEADAPAHPSLPDFSLTLVSRQLNLLGRDGEPLERPRRVEKKLQPGVYFVHLESINDHDDRLSYKLEVKTPRKRARIRPPKTQRPKRRTPAPPPEPPKPVFLLETAILEVERDGGEPVAVLLEAGTGTGLQRGMRGELREGDTTIGEIEIVAVYAQGSRARIVGGLSAPITFDTRARVRK